MMLIRFRNSIAIIALSAFLLPNARAGDAKLGDDHDIAAFQAALYRTANAWIQYRHAAVAPRGFAPGDGDQFILTPPVFLEGQIPEARIWIMASGYPATPAPGNDPHANATELDQWNGRRVFITSEFGDDFVKSARAALAATNGPLIANVIAANKWLELELINRSDKPVRVYHPFYDTTSVNDGWNIIVDDFCQEQWAQSPTPGEVKARIATLAPGQRLRWPMRAPVAPGSDAKLDGCYFVDAYQAKELTIPKLSIYAPTVRAHCDADGRYTVTPWKPTPLSSAERAESLRLAGFAGQWFDPMKRKITTATAPDAFAQDFIDRDATGNICDMRCVVHHGSAAVVVEAVREQDRRGLAIADTADPIKWDGQKSERAFRVPGSDWILRTDVGRNPSPQVESAIDEQFNEFLATAKGK
jgi:hypothetical protein